ncbi:sugar kinase [Parerythrobacter aurantius]|uniref:sugar kinase n=1 Tax=Parerythrobacter aurantius TaxID=3127706 RepID=UPI0032464F8C
MGRIVVIGEAMIERHDGAAHTNYGGDTLNTAVHLARLGHDVAYVTALGRDAESDWLRHAWSSEGIDTTHVLQHQDRTVGRYAIALDRHGERTFTYDRDRSAARDMFALAGIEAAMQAADDAALVIYSLITLAILPPTSRDRLLALSAPLAFDGNYRARLWSDRHEAAEVRDLAVSHAGIGLPTLEDEAMIMGGETSPDGVARHWQSLGCKEVVVKMGASGARLPDGEISPPGRIVRPVDTSGAGDAFNAGYLSARLRGGTPAEAAAEGHRIAGWTIMRQGAIPPLSA